MICIGNVITQNYTKITVEQLSNDLSEVKGELLKIKNEGNNIELEKKVEKIRNDWDKSHNKLAYYIEHNELEKVEDNFTGMQSYIETFQYEDAINQLDKSVFILNHIQEKYAFSLENVF